MTDLRSYSPLNVTIESNELVRGQEHKFIERLEPLVRRESIVLNLENVERIDAAGLAALITLYCDACQAGKHFAISNPSRHVREILAIVGLDRILAAQPGTECDFANMQLEASAA